VQFGDAAGFPFPGGVKNGDVATVLGYVATQLHTRVEPCVNGWCWGYTYKANVNNPSQLSCHASGTAIDWNAPDHPNGSSNTFSDQQIGVIYTILNEVQGAVSWLYGYDEMHFEICVDAGDLAAVAASLPGGAPPPPEQDWFDMATEDDLRRIVREEVGQRLADLDPTIRETYNRADWTNERTKGTDERLGQLDPVIRDTFNYASWTNTNVNTILAAVTTESPG
jgi:hypothetical protein